MTRAKRWWTGRGALGLLLGLSVAAACVGAKPEPAAPVDGTADGAQSSWVTAQSSPGAAPPTGGYPAGGCPHGAIIDADRNFVRCLAPEEAAALIAPLQPGPAVAAAADAGPTPPPARDAGAPAVATAPPAVATAPPAAPVPADAGPADGGAAVAAPEKVPGPPPIVEFKPATFTSGDVPKIDQKLEKLAGKIEKCVADNGGLTGSTGSLKVQFLVRAQGKAEGVEVLGAKGVGKEAAECVRRLLKNRTVGTPSSDPVGVTVSLSFKPGPAPAP